MSYGGRGHPSGGACLCAPVSDWPELERACNHWLEAERGAGIWKGEARLEGA